MIRRQIFSKAKLSGLAGVGYCTAVATGTPSTTIDTLSGFLLDGTGSSSSLGTISTYLWEIVYSTLTIDSPTSSTTGLSGAISNGDLHTFKLTVTDSLGNTNSTTVLITISIAVASQPSITHTPATGTTGVIEITDGAVTTLGNEDVLDIQFVLSGYGSYPLNSPDAIEFSGITSSGDLAYYKIKYNTQVTLDVNGEYTSSYTAIGDNFQCDIRIFRLNGAIYSKEPERSTSIIISTSGGEV